MSRKILDNEWIVEVEAEELTIRVDKLLGKDDQTLVRKLGKLLAKENLKGIYKVFARLSSMTSLLKRSDIIWRKYYSHGVVNVIKGEKGHFIIEVQDYEPAPTTCMGVLGWLDFILELYKKEGTARHTHCKLRGDKTCTYEITWKQ